MQTKHSRTDPRAEDLTVLVLEEHDSIWLPEARREVQAAREAMYAALNSNGYAYRPLRIRSPRGLQTALAPLDPRAHIVFNWHEGAEWGADDLAQIVGILDALGYTYTGADMRALLMTQDKTRAKRVLELNGVPTPSWQMVLNGAVPGWNLWPAIVKVATEHGSEGLTRDSVVHNRRALSRHVAALDGANPWQLMVSEFLGGREFAVSLWGNFPVEVLPLVEIDYETYPPGEPHVRTHDSKWHAPARAICPAHLPGAMRKRIEQVARRAYHAFELRDYARIDIRLRDDEPHVIDVNPNPDITSDSSFVMSAHQASYDYAAMIGRLVTFAIERRPPAGCVAR